MKVSELRAQGFTRAQIVCNECYVYTFEDLPEAEGEFDEVVARPRCRMCGRWPDRVIPWKEGQPAPGRD